ncbi:MAG: hypothetical protein IE890_10960, partial [Arcobacter sp.]|nr:hypothetical protein [Arcobacter sp.]
GEAISVLIRGYYLTKDEKYLQKAQQVSAPFHHEINNNGVLSKIDNHFLFLEEYPSIKQQYVLNGFFYSFIGLSEYNFMVKDDEKNKKLYIEFEDNAGGISKNFLNKIFEPYFSTKSNKNGTGLGLYMIKTIIEQYSFGKIDVYNTEIGTKFIIELPLK